MSEYTFDWFSGNIGNLTRWLAGYVGKPVRSIEIGSFEGMSTSWFVNNILTHPDASIHCIETFKGSDEHSMIDFAAVKQRFMRNIGWNSKVKLHVGNSTEVLRQFKTRFDFAYIDGSHKACDVYADAIAVWPKIRVGGIVVFDDYTWDYYKTPEDMTQNGIDKFCRETPNLRILESNHQLSVVKTSNKS